MEGRQAVCQPRRRNVLEQIAFLLNWTMRRLAGMPTSHSISEASQRSSLHNKWNILDADVKLAILVISIILRIWSSTSLSSFEVSSIVSYSEKTQNFSSNCKNLPLSKPDNKRHVMNRMLSLNDSMNFLQFRFRVSIVTFLLPFQSKIYLEWKMALPLPDTQVNSSVYSQRRQNNYTGLRHFNHQ